MKKIFCLVSLLYLIFPHMVNGDPGLQYCIKPPFITGTVKPNLLMMIDNSASMYDLAYVDKGRKHCAANASKGCNFDSDCNKCSATTTQACYRDTDCPAGETCNKADTCSIFDRDPYYCYDETYRSVEDFYGYFDKDTFYYYRSDSDDFAPVTSVFPSGCGANAANTTKTIADTLCVEYTSTKALANFVAKGNYLNWLTASKLDVEKKILTGGKFDGSALIPESRGCVGQGYVKDAITADFINYNNMASDPNVPLGVTFTIVGPENSNNPTAPSTGGQTYINLFAGKDFNFAACQQAIQDLASGGNADIKQSVAACLEDNGAGDGTCKQLSMTCGTNSDCYRTKIQATTAYVCTNDLAKTCNGTTDTETCNVPARNSCEKKPTLSCSTDAECEITVPAVLGKCSTDKAMYTPAPGKNDTPLATACSSDAACTFRSTGTDFVGKAGSCIGEAASYANNVGPCVITGAADYGPCVSNYVGDCIFSSQQAATKTKVAFQQNMQECWTIRGETHTAADNYGFSNMNTVKNQCPDIYSSYKTCHNNHMKQCSVDTDCAADGTVSCDSGPAAISEGNPALLCGTNYEGQFYEQDSKGNWVLKAGVTDLQMAERQYAFCSNMTAPNVTDPTDAPSNTTVTDNLPAIVSGLGVEAQLGAPIKKMRARIATNTLGSGLIGQFADQIRFGIMSFNKFGSASETSLAGVGTPKTCSNDADKVCTQSIDCGSGNICDPTTAGSTNFDGASLKYPIGYGACATMTTTPCKVDSDCSGLNACLEGFCGSKGSTVCTTAFNCTGSNQACIRNGVGDHTTGGSMLKVLDDIRANAWTPFSEAFYNAIGYFAQIGSGTNAGKSRTALRLNEVNTDSTDPGTAIDFNENFNPSEYRCQQNYVLLISDGSSTADRNTTVNSLASLYASQAGITQTTCTGAPSGTATDFGGNNNLPILSWLAKHRNIAEFNLTGTASTAAPVNARDSINSYVVFNGASNGASGDCNSETLLSKTASKGGTEMLKAGNYTELVSALTKVFTDVAAQAASGTAASILSNSEGSGANILQAVFFPKKIFENDTSSKWVGEMQNLWYYVDPKLSNSTIREDSDKNKKLHLVNDYVTRFFFDTASNQTKVELSKDTNGDGAGDTSMGVVLSDDVKSIWRAGKLLWERDLSTSPRKIKTSINGTSLIEFSSDLFRNHDADGNLLTTNNVTTLRPYLNAIDGAEAEKIMNWVHGQDQTGYRLRQVQITDPETNVIHKKVWRLGDIITSTPRVQASGRLNAYDLPSPNGYKDASYASFVGSTQYKNHGMVYVGANDGMYHAFKLGKLDVTASGFNKASLAGSNLGEEQWAFIPKNVLPYLKYLTDPDYNHLYYIDGSTSIFDASIGSCTENTDYSLCVKPNSVVDSNNDLTAGNPWRSVLIGGMGLGGASSLNCASGAPCVATPRADPADGSRGLGYSSYFALDVTNDNDPKLMWEFSDAAIAAADRGLGYATTGPSIFRIGSSNKNGKWFAVFASGPTGPINTTTNQFKGSSNQNLKFYVVDLKAAAPFVKGTNYWVIDSGLANAFAGSMIGGAIDVDRGNTSSAGNYQDDALYVGYVQANTATIDNSTTWTKGGVLRLITKEDPNPANWVVSKVIDDIGPVTTAIARLQDKKNRNLWLYFGTGRYYYRAPSDIDDNTGTQALYGIKEPCYNTAASPGNILDKTCTATRTLSELTLQGDASTAVADNGWYVSLDAASSNAGAERVVTDTVALTNGTVFFTSFKPTQDICGFGGFSYLWSIKYDTGLNAACSALEGKALIQLSTGEFKEVDLTTAFGCPNKTGLLPPDGDPDPLGPTPPPPPPPPDRGKRRMSTPMTGKPPADAPPILSKSGNRPIKRIIHIQER